MKVHTRSHMDSSVVRLEDEARRVIPVAVEEDVGFAPMPHEASVRRLGREPERHAVVSVKERRPRKLRGVRAAHRQTKRSAAAQAATLQEPPQAFINSAVDLSSSQEVARRGRRRVLQQRRLAARQ